MKTYIDAGELRELIIIRELCNDIDENGFEVETYKDIYNLRCKVKTVSSKEYLSADGDKINTTYRFICRKRDINSEKHFIYYKKMLFNIKHIHEPDKYFFEITGEAQALNHGYGL
ncbi:phage head closure protein [uncultured Clostridium sp.]|uniref:phage head closure protein n=1 Tax=uncultured Clostridium sp. TaxID=59620 RepID=UPI0025FA7F96|nr:phage head closure protein [uncultured Clostridium sp.]